jgi:hypothetical protein
MELSETPKGASPPAFSNSIMLNLSGVVGIKGSRGVGFENYFLKVPYGYVPSRTLRLS